MTAGDSVMLNEMDGRGRYSVNTEEGEAELCFQLDDNRRMVINHTYVPPAARGRQIGLKLLERAVKDAMTRGLKIVPECSYAARIAGRRKEWAGVFV